MYRSNNKKQQISFVFSAFIFIFLVFGGQSVQAGLVGYWKFDEGSGTVAHDSSGNNYTGTITGAAWVNDGAMGKVLDFEGVDYVTIPPAAFSTISSKVTIALWQYGDVVLQPQNNSIFYGINSAGTRVLNVHLPWGSGSIIYDAGYSGTTYDRIDKAASEIQYEGQWNNWVFTKDTVAGEMKIYLNGQLWHSSTGKTKAMSGITQFKIGSQADGTYNYDGMICEFSVYNVVLTAEEINKLSGQSYSSEPSPAHRYVDVSPSLTLSWKPGPLAVSHDVYFGTSSDLVTNRSSLVYAGQVNTNHYTPAPLRLATTYYWAADDVNDSEPLSPWVGEVWRFTVRNTTEGYYKDLFIDAGIGISAYKANDIPAVGMLGYSNEHIDSSNRDTTRKIMIAANSGNWVDDNGTLLYPDNEPRFRLFYGNGGSSGSHYTALEPEGTGIMQTYVNNGGCYTGSCASAWLSGPHKWGVVPTHLNTTSLGSTFTDGTIPDGKTTRLIYNNDEVWVIKPAVPISPILRQNYYPEFFNDLKIHGIYHNGGCRTDPHQTTFSDHVSWDKDRNEALVLFDMTWALKGGVERDFTTDPNAAKTWKMDHNNCMVWSYKGSDTSGRSVPSGSHPEHRTEYGEEKYLQASIYRYAYSGFGKATVKAALTDGVARSMNDNTIASHAKIGDYQYHHFTFEVQPGTTKLEITLDGNLYDMNLYAKHGDFAFKGEQSVISAANGTGSDETLTIVNPQAGTWYIGVKCNERVAATYGGSNYAYTGRYELLNGIPYTITAATKRLIAGDIDYDGQVDRMDAKILAENWLINNAHYRQNGELIGRWNFTDVNNFTMDSSGHGNTVTFSGNAAWTGEGVTLDGAGDYLQTVNNSNLQVTDEYTIAFRLNAAATQVEGAGIITKCGTEGVPVNHWSLCFGGGATAGKIVAFNGMAMWDTGIALAQITGDWHDIAVVFGGGYMSSYLDGVQKKWDPFAALPVSGNGNLKIGTDRQKIRCYKGQIDDVSIFNYESTPQEVEGLFESSPGFGDPVGKWTFNDGTTSDSSGNGHNGTLMDNAAIVEDAQRGKVLSLTGKAYVTLPADAFADVNDQITITLWQYGADSQPKIGAIFFGSNSNGKVLLAELPWSDGSVYFDAGNATGGQYDRIVKAAQVSDYKGRWNHWVFTKDASEGTMAMYLNGQLWSSGTGKTMSMTGITSFMISHPSMSYDGLVDDFFVYTYCMSANEVQHVYEAGLTEKLVCPKKPIGDLNSDCAVNYSDFVIVAKNWLK